MRSLTKILLTGALVLAGTALAEAQQTICTRIGNMVTCNTPTYPSGQPGGAGAALGGFADTFLRMQEAQPPVVIIQPQAPPPATPPARGGKSPEQAASYCYEQVKKMGFNSRDIEDRSWEDCMGQFRQQIGGRP
jgi:hypothetical protein